METKHVILELREKAGLSQLFDVSINTLLGTPRQLICQCCGMPLKDSSISREPDGAFNEEYCKWCYADGKFAYTDMDVLIDFCAEHMSNENWPAEQVRTYMKEKLPLFKFPVIQERRDQHHKA